MTNTAQARLSESAGIVPSRFQLDLVNVALWALVLTYSAARFLQIFPGKIPMSGVVAFHVFPPLIFAVIQGTALYRWHGVGAFIVLFLLIGNLFENLSVTTGFPFGHYYFTDLMGPKIFQVPIFLGLAYVGMGYLSWILANLILGTHRHGISTRNLVLLPLLASAIMTSWDLSQDPIWSTFLHLWIWPRGGIYFGVPISNFCGWLLTLFVIYFAFALYVGRRTPASEPLRQNCWRVAVIFYAICAAGNLLPLARAANLAVGDPSGAAWNLRSMALASAGVSVFMMGAFALLAWMKIARTEASRHYE